jgi:hypothetical protein
MVAKLCHLLRIVNAFYYRFWYIGGMTHNRSAFLMSVLVFGLLAFPFWTEAESASLDLQLRDHTFVYIDKNTNLEHTVYFGRFGNVYDEYYRHILDKEYPCKFVDGTWRITDAATLCLEDSTYKNFRDGKTCLKPKILGNQVSFFDSAGKLAYQAKLTKGNGMPLG